MDHRQTEIFVDELPDPEPLTKTIDLSVIIVNYNVCDFLEQSLKSVLAARGSLRIEVFVVDNNSADGSVEMVRDRFPSVHLISNQENAGFGRANNMAIARASGRYILILNPDTIVKEDTLTKLVAFMDEHRDAGAVGCQILNPDGTFARESRRSFPTPDVAFYRMTGLSRLFPKSRRFGRYNMTYLPIDETAEVDALSGSCMMLRREALAHGRTDSDGTGASEFDESFFMYGEDLDLCYRIQKSGWKIFYYPETQIIHYKGESTKKGDLRYVYLFYGAMLLFIEKHFDPNRSKILRFLLRAGIVLRAGMSILKSSLASFKAPLLDLGIVYATVTLVALSRFVWIGGQLAPLFYATISPVYATATVAAIWVARGYRRGPRYPVKPVFIGTLAGFFIVAAISYFIPAVGFSRIVVAVSLPLSAILLSFWRAVKNSDSLGIRTAVLVGNAGEADRLSEMIKSHPHPPFTVEGYVSNGETTAHPLRIGRINQLRDIIRLRGVHDIIFAAHDLSNETIFKTMQELQDLKVQFRMLHEGSEQLIGKAAVSQLSAGTALLDMTEVVDLRTGKAQRAYDVLVCVSAILLLPLSPLFLVLARIPVKPFIRKLRCIPSVLAGRKSLVGGLEDHIDVIPASWGLKNGVFSITNTLPTQELDNNDLMRAYWFYVTHQSPALDADIMIRSLRDESKSS